MELREWLIILGLALVTLIVIDGVRRLQRQRRVPRLDRVDGQSIDEARGQEEDPEAAAREAELNWELPNGGARVVRPASYDTEAQRPAPKPKLRRQEHPGPSRVLAEWQANRPSESAPAAPPEASCDASPVAGPEPEAPRREPSAREASADIAAADSATPPPSEPAQVEPSLGLSDDDQAGDAAAKRPTTPHDEPVSDATESALVTDPADHDFHGDDERYRLVDFDGMADSFKSGSVKMGQSMQRFGAGIKKGLHERREQNRQRKQERERQKAEQAAAESARRQQQELEQKQQEAERRQAEAQAAEQRRLEADKQATERRQADVASDIETEQDPLFSASRPSYRDSRYDEPPAEPVAEGGDEAESGPAPAHPVLEKALRNDVEAPQAREALSHAEEVIVISVMCREEDGFSGTALLKLMLACGLRYSREMGIFHRFETEADDSPLQFSMVNVVKPGTFPLDALDDFATPGITFLMPLPGAEDTSAAFEAMVECAMVVVRHLGGELKDENHSVMTAQTVEFARQKVHEFERRHRLQRYQVN